MKKEKKIVIPTEEEVKAYTGTAETMSSSAASSPSDKTPAQSAEPAATAASEQTAISGENTLAGSADGTVPSEMSEAELWKDKYLRIKAELANYQKRSEKDRAEAIRFANGTLVRALLPTIDDLERVIESSKNHAGNVQGTIDGIMLILDGLLKTLRDFQVEVIPTEGQLFDPRFHEAMMEQPSAEYPERTVLKELTKGYRLNDRVLRAAKVITSRKAEEG